MAASENSNIVADSRCAKSVRIRSYSGPYAVRMQENTDENNSEYEHFFELIFQKNGRWKKKFVCLLLIKLKTIKHSKQVKQSNEKKHNNKMMSSKETTEICLFVTFPRR